jgi:hypothetical protein
MSNTARDAMRVVFASAIVQGCETKDENLARRLRRRVGTQQKRKGITFFGTRG